MKTAYLFPGQGSQFPGMGRDLAACGPAARALVPAAEEATGLPLAEWLHRADAATIADPQAAHVCVFVYSSVLWHEFDARGEAPDLVAGHSLGEFTALAAAGGLDWPEALRLVAHRGREMSEAAREEPGAMGAIVGLAPDAVSGLCRDHGAGSVVVANENSARQFVVSGAADGVLAVLDAAKELGAIRARRLPVGGAYHSPLMARAAARFAERLAAVPLRPLRVPLISSVTGAVVTDLGAYRAALTGQMTAPVRWRSVMAALAAAGTDRWVEVGPGRVLGGLGREAARAARQLTGLDALHALASAEPVAIGGSR